MSHSVNMVIFENDTHRYAMELHAVLETMPPGPITPIPIAPPTILGAMNARGQVVVVLDLTFLLYRKPSQQPLGKLAILIQQTDYKFIIVAQRLLELREIQHNDLSANRGDGELFSLIEDPQFGSLCLLNLPAIMTHLTEQMAAVAAQLQGDLNLE